jgi:hypothetical protein
MGTWITISVIALIPLLLRTRKAFTPLRVSSRDPSRFAGGFHRYAIHTFTGYASDVNRDTDSITTGSIGSSMSPDGKVASVSGSIDTSVVSTDRFFLTDGQGQVHGFSAPHFGAQVGNGHLVSVAWVIHGRSKKGAYFLLYNHTLERTFFSVKAIRAALTSPHSPYYIALLILLILPIPVLVVFGLVEMVRVGQFKRTGARPLIERLQAEAAELPRTAVPNATVTQASPTFARELREVTELRDSGAITQEEFEAAKAKLLST